MKWNELDRFTQGYINRALSVTLDQSNEDPGCEPMDRNYGVHDIAPDTLARMVEDCRIFQDDNRQDLEDCELSFERQGHDFWLNRNGHGSGFWDEGDDPVFRRLSDASKAWGTFDLYVGDDGMIHGG